jgi:hypothetical protein
MVACRGDIDSSNTWPNFYILREVGGKLCLTVLRQHGAAPQMQIRTGKGHPQLSCVPLVQNSCDVKESIFGRTAQLPRLTSCSEISHVRQSPVTMHAAHQWDVCGQGVQLRTCLSLTYQKRSSPVPCNHSTKIGILKVQQFVHDSPNLMTAVELHFISCFVRRLHGRCVSLTMSTTSIDEQSQTSRCSATFVAKPHLQVLHPDNKGRDTYTQREWTREQG